MTREHLQQLPKAELHIHIEGTLEPPQLMRFAARNKVAIPFTREEDIRAAYQFRSLDDFLAIYYQGMAVLRTEQDFADLAIAYFDRVALQGVRHVEFFFDPQAHLGRGISFGTIMAGLAMARRHADSVLGISTLAILCVLRDRSEADALATLRLAEPFLDQIVGIGLDSSEAGYPPSDFVRVFDRARAMGLRCVAHAGEDGPASYVRQAVELLQVERIEHGIRVMDDPALVAELAARGTAFTVCPIANWRLRLVDRLEDHPFAAMQRAGLAVSLNSDDPAYFGAYILDVFDAASSRLGMTDVQLAQIAARSFTTSFLPAPAVDRHIRAIRDWGNNAPV